MKKSYYNDSAGFADGMAGSNASLSLVISWPSGAFISSILNEKFARLNSELVLFTKIRDHRILIQTPLKIQYG
jgi:hypothetical protein